MPAVTQQAKSFLRTVTGGRDETLIAERMALCEQCDHMKRNGGKRYCGKCRCGQWPMAELHYKLAFKNWSCPVGHWGRQRVASSGNCIPNEWIMKNMRPLYREESDG